MKHLIFFNSIIFSIIFFILTSLLGVNYLGTEDSSLYTTSCVVVNMLAIMAFVHGLFLKKLRINVQLLVVVLIQFLVLIMYGIESPTNDYAVNSILIVYAFSAPACYTAYYIAKTKSFNEMIKWLDVLMILLTISVAINLPTILAYKAFGDISTNNIVTNINYQSAAYYTALAYSINLLFLLKGASIRVFRFKYTRSKIYKIISTILLALQVIMCLMSGGRGGFLLVVITTLSMISLFGFKSLNKVVAPFLFVCAISLVAVSILQPEILSTLVDVLADSTERTFSYITNDGIDLEEGSSGRDLIYEDALISIQQQPILGYGLFKYLDTSLVDFYPHNIFLEILLQGGGIYFLLMVGLLFYLFTKFKTMMLKDMSNMFLLPFILYVLTMLMFSGSYMTSPLFWFVVVYILCYNIKNDRNIIKINK